MSMVQQLWMWVLNNPATFSQLFFSGTLAAVTIVYTFFTWRQTGEMEKTRQVSNQPVVKGKFGLMGPINLILEIQNTGNSPAHNVNGEVFFKDIDIESLDFYIPILSEDEAYEFGLPQEGGEEGGFFIGFGEIQNLIDEYNSEGILVVETEFENPFGEEYENRAELDILSFMDNKSHIIHDGEEEKIRKAIEGIDSSLEDVSNQLNSGPRSESADHKLYSTILEAIKGNESIQINALHYITGISQTKIYDIVDDLERAGLVETPEDKHPMLQEDTEITYLGGDINIGTGAGDVDVGHIFDSVEDNSESAETKDNSEVETEKK